MHGTSWGAAISSKPTETHDSIKFGDDFELDLRSYQLRQSGRALKLEPTPMELLFFLIGHRGELITRDQIVEKIWGQGVFLDTDNSINGAIRKIRQALRDNPEQPRFIQTITGKGYLFIAPVIEPALPEVKEPQEKDLESARAAIPDVGFGKRRKGALAAAVGVLTMALVAAAYGVYAFLSRSRPVPFQNSSIEKITETGNATLVAISPDGKYILNVMDDKGQQSLWLRNAPTNSNTQVMPPEPLWYRGVRFSPDGNYLYFVRGEMGQPLNYLYRAPVLGGTPQKLVTDVDSNITFSPDGRNLAYVVNNNPRPGQFRLVTYSLETGEGKTLVTGNMDQGVRDPAWSPDGKTIVCVIYQPGDAFSGLVAVDAITGKQNIFSGSKWGFLGRPVWLPGGSGLLALSWGKETNYRRRQIVEISYPDGSARAVTHDISDYTDLDLAADGRTLATLLQQDHYDLFVVPTTALGTSQTQQLTSGAPVYDFSWTPDGQIIFSQEWSLSAFNLESRSKTPLTSTQQDGLAFRPSVCANGRYVVFSIVAHGDAKTTTIWRMDAGGGNLKQLSDGKNDQFAVCSPDGKWVFYTDLSNGKKLIRVPLDGGKSERLSELTAYTFDISSDGKLAAFVTHVPTKTRLALFPVDFPQNMTLLDVQRPVQGAVRFTHDGKAVVYPFRDQDADNLWLQPLDGSPGKQITNLKSEKILDFHWSFDGSKLGMVRGHTDSDVVLLQDSKP